MPLSDKFVIGPGICDECHTHDEKCIMIEDAQGKSHVMHRACYLSAKKIDPSLKLASL